MTTSLKFYQYIYIETNVFFLNIIQDIYEQTSYL